MFLVPWTLLGLVLLVIGVLAAMVGIRSPWNSQPRRPWDMSNMDWGDRAEGGLIYLAVMIVISPFYFGWMLVRKGLPMLRERAQAAVRHEAEEAAQQLVTEQLQLAAKSDPIWNEDAVKAHAEKVFFLERRARVSRDQTFVRDHLTPQLYAHQQRETDLLIARHEKNMLEKMRLLGVRVVKVAHDQADPARDVLWIRIQATKIDFLISDQNGQTTGSTSKEQAYSEIWKFVRGPRGWLLDEIVPA